MNKNTRRATPSRLLIAESERGADMLYATGFRAPDEFILLLLSMSRFLH